MLDFLLATDLGRWMPGAEADDAVSTVSELKVQEWMKKQGAGAKQLGVGEEPLLLPPTRDFVASTATM